MSGTDRSKNALKNLPIGARHVCHALYGREPVCLACGADGPVQECENPVGGAYVADVAVLYDAVRVP